MATRPRIGVLTRVTPAAVQSGPRRQSADTSIRQTRDADFPPPAERSVIVLFGSQNLFEDESSFVGDCHAHRAAERVFTRGLPSLSIAAIDHGDGVWQHELLPFMP